MGLVMVRRMRIKWQPEFGQEKKGNAGKVWVPSFILVLSSSSPITPSQQVGLGENINVLASLCALQIPSPPLSSLSPSLSLLLLLRGK